MEENNIPEVAKAYIQANYIENSLSKEFKDIIDKQILEDNKDIKSE